MNIVAKHTNVFSFFKVKDSLIVIERDEITREQISKILGTQKKMKTQFLRNCGDYLYDLGIDKILIYDSEFNYLYDIKEKGISLDNTSVDFLDDEILIISQSIWDDNYNLVSYFNYYEHTNKKERDVYCGRFLNNQFRINFIYEERYNPTYIRLSNLLDTETYFEYNCEQGEEITGEIIKYKEKLIFYTREREKQLYDSKFWINVLDIKTGKTIYKILVENYGACFDYGKGQFVSILGTNQNNKIIKKYEIVDVNNGTVDRDDFNFHQEMFAVGTAVQHTNNNKLYFVDNVYSYIEQKRKSPKIGCFDVTTKQITFFEELKEAEGFSINQIISKDNMTYVKTDNNELFVLEI
jgi:hypothetical protein